MATKPAKNPFAKGFPPPAAIKAKKVPEGACGAAKKTPMRKGCK